MTRAKWFLLLAVILFGIQTFLCAFLFNAGAFSAQENADSGVAVLTAYGFSGVLALIPACFLVPAGFVALFLAIQNRGRK